ncbi:hypothetical protein GH714_005173 [Hevea brasiliensis]|uniref:Uncharacterized protein n=1 Tax=Hevea brasiliensis TaxID=3981 RepID=A0A6A6KPR6_HEVBR|nr:hypothetical protein GH714_005173 [Hevea brasiliensis]
MEPPIVNVKEYVDGEGDKSEWGKRIGDKENVGVHNLEDDTYVSYEFESTLRTEDSFFKDFVEHGLAHDIIRPRGPEFKDIPPQIANDELYMPYFKGCIGCMVAHMWQHAFLSLINYLIEEGKGRYYLVDKGYLDKERLPSTIIKVKRWKILNKRPQFNVETKIRIIVATFVLHSYIRINSQSDPIFQVLEHYPDFIPPEVLSNVHDTSTNCENIIRSVEMKNIRNHIADSLWYARRRNLFNLV